MKEKFRVHKKTLSNGMTVLIRPTHVVPEVVVQLWYNVGSKDEGDGERGMAHLIEHMIFKGTKKLSETDIDLVTFKLSGYANAFTSNDYTCYVYKFPSNVWTESLKLLADCMQNARFDTEMLHSELHAVIQELKLYKDDYQGSLIEKMMQDIFQPHPYHHPIIGYKYDLWDLDRDALYAFYKKHYHPSNATLVIVGDTTVDDALNAAKECFENIPAQPDYKKAKRFFLDDLYKVDVTLSRAVDNPWSFYAYQAPGLDSGSMYLFDMMALLIGRGRSSRLYEKLVNETKLATSVGCFSYDLFEKSLFFIYVQPTTIDVLPRIEAIIDEELYKLAHDKIEDWEFSSIKKKAEMGYCSLLESMDRQAEIIGSAFLAMGDEHYIDTYRDNILKTKRSELQKGIKTYLQPMHKHSGRLIPASEDEKMVWAELQKKSDALDKEILKHKTRTSSVEPGAYVAKVEEKKLPDFTYPVPEHVIMDNGLEVIYHHNPAVPKVSVLLSLKADHLYETEGMSGMSRFLSRLFLEGTKKYNAKELNQHLESEGIYLSVDSGLFAIEMLKGDLEKGLSILHHVLTESTFTEEAIEKVRYHSLAELKEFWDTPSLFVDALAREVVYDGHPYAKNRLGHKECVARFTRDDVVDFYNTYVTPERSVLVIVGDIEGYDIKKVVEKALGGWSGKAIEDLLFPEISYKEPKIIHRPIDRDQTVLAFAAPSVSRLDANFDAMAVLDFILTGSGISSSSRLYQLREQTGIFYTVGGSLTYGANTEPGMMFIKTLVSLDKVEMAEDLIKKTIKNLRENGISQAELHIAVKSLIASSVRIFESNARVAQAFLFVKRCGVNLDLFDKRGALLSILKVDVVNNIASRYCKENFLSTIRVGRRSG